MSNFENISGKTIYLPNGHISINPNGEVEAWLRSKYYTVNELTEIIEKMKAAARALPAGDGRGE